MVTGLGETLGRPRCSSTSPGWGVHPLPPVLPLPMRSVVKRRVAAGRDLDVQGCLYPAGSVVTLSADHAARLDAAGFLYPLDVPGAGADGGEASGGGEAGTPPPGVAGPSQRVRLARVFRTLAFVSLSDQKNSIVLLSPAPAAESGAP